MLHRARWRLAAVIAVVGPAVAAPLAVAATSAGQNGEACRRVSSVVARTDGWTSIRPPASLTELRGTAADPHVPRRIYAYDATTVVRSDDGGCSWHTVFNAPATTPGKTANLAQSHVDEVVVGAGVWVTTAATAGKLGAATVWHSPTGSGSFSYAGAGLPVGGTVLQLVPTVKTGVAYALVQTLTGPRLYASSQAVGSTVTWQARTVPNFIRLTAIAADPNIPDLLDVASPYAYARSANGGATFKTEKRVPSRIDAIDAAGPYLDVYLASGRLLSVGTGKPSIPAPAGVESATHVQLEPGVRAVSTAYGDFGYDPTAQKWLPISPLGLVAQHLQLVSPSLPPTLYGVAAGFIFELPLHFPAAFVLSPPNGQEHSTAVSLHGVSGFGKELPSFAPAPKTITLHVGAQRTAHYLLRVPARSGPLDVDFLVDTTNSMLPAIDGLRHGMQQIIGALAHLTPNLEVGLGDFRDYNDGVAKVSDVVNGEPSIALKQGCPEVVGSVLNKHHLYIRDQQIAPVGASLGAALGRLRACGGGDIAEADTIAVMQSITGAGVPGWVAPGQEAGFRPDATKVIVLITDAPAHQHAPYPSLAATIDALRAYNVRLVGISINDGLNEAAKDLRALAAGSRTDAPAGGLACRGGRRADVPAGAPMVCSVPITGAGIAVLAGPVARLIEQVVAPGLLAVHLHSARPGVASLTGASSEHANLHTKSLLPVTVVYRCPLSAAGSTTPITLNGSVGKATVARTDVQLHCLANPAPFVPAATVVLPAVVAAQPPPPPPVSSNINPNVNPGTGAATEQEQQNQLAVADLGQQSDTQPAVNDDGTDMGAPMLYTAALLMTGAAAYALRLRTQPAPNLARVRRKGTR